MPNLQEWALDWFESQRLQHMSETVTLTTATGSSNISVSIIDPESETNPAGVSIKTDKVLFMVKSEDLDADKIRRGIRFVRPGYGTYEAVIEKNVSEYNDPNHNCWLIPCKFKHQPSV